MSTPVLTADPSETLADRFFPVVADGELVSGVAMRDLVCIAQVPVRGPE